MSRFLFLTLLPFLGLLGSVAKIDAQDTNQWVDYPLGTGEAAEIIAHPFIEDRGVVEAVRGLPFRFALTDLPTGITRFGASGLPAGLRISETTGEISGAPMLSGEMAVVVHAHREEEPIAFFRIQLHVSPPSELSSIRDTVLPEGSLFRAQSAPASTSDSGTEPFPVSGAYLTFSEPWPSGIDWNTSQNALIGTAESPGVSVIPYTWGQGEPQTSGRLVISAGDYRSAVAIEGAAQRLAMNGNIVVALTNDDRPYVRAVLPEAWPNEPIPSTEHTPPWTDGGADPTNEVVFSTFGDNQFIYRNNFGRVFISSDGQSWEETHPTLDQGEPMAVSRIFTSREGILVNGQDVDTTALRTAVSYNGTDWHLVEKYTEQSIEGILAAVHNGDKWFALTDQHDVRTSTDGIVWERVEGVPNFPLGSHLTFFNGKYYALWEGASALGGSNMSESDDFLHWGNIEGTPSEKFTQLITGDDAMFGLSQNGVYQWNQNENRFDLIWMAPPHTINTDGAYADGNLVVATNADSWLLRPEELAPQLQGPLPFPALDQQVMETGDAISYSLVSNQEESTFKAYDLPEGVSLDPDTGSITGAFPEHGVYKLVVGVENDNGESVPRVLTFLVHGEGVPQSGRTARFTSPQNENDRIYVSREPGGATLEISGDLEGREMYATGLPPGLKMNWEDLTLEGWAQTKGYYNVEIHLFSEMGTETFNAPILIYEGEITRPMVEQLNPGDPIDIWVGVPEEGITHVAYQLPLGLDLDPESGAISGSIMEVGLHHALVTEVDLEGIPRNPRAYSFRVGDPYLEGIQALQPIMIPKLVFVDSATNATTITDRNVIRDPEEIEFISLPSGFTHHPPYDITVDSQLAPGFYRGRARVTSASGFSEADWWFGYTDYIAEPERTHVGITWNFPPKFYKGMPISATLVTPDNASIVVANLPPGITYDAETRVISGTLQAAGIYEIGMMAIKDGKTYALAWENFRIEAFPDEEAIMPIEHHLYFTGLRNRETDRSLHLDADADEFIGSVRTLPGTEIDRSDGSGRLFGRPTSLGASDVYVELLNGSSYQWPSMVYPSPVWESDRTKARFLPRPNLFQLDQVVVLEKYTPFSTFAGFHSTSNNQDWKEYPFPQNARFPSAPDILVRPEGYVLGGEAWLATATALSSLRDAQPTVSFEALANNNAIYVAVGRGQSSISSNLSDWDHIWDIPMGVSFDAITYGEGRFVAVGEGGVSLYVNDDRTQGFVELPVDEALSDVIFASGEFIAVGVLGTIIKSSDGENWVIDRAPRDLGAEFRYVRANDDLIVAVSPYLILGKRRDEPTSDWLPMRRVTVQGSLLDNLQWEDGSHAGGYGSGLYIPRRPEGSVTVLSAPHQPALMGEHFIYDIAAIGGDVSYRVDGLPEGLSFDAAKGRIEGDFVEPGSYQILIEATSGDQSHGKSLSVYCWEGPPRLRTTEIVIPAGSDPAIEWPIRLAVPCTEIIEEEYITHDSTTFRLHTPLRRLPDGQIIFPTLLIASHNLSTREGVSTANLRLANPAGRSYNTVTLKVLPPKPSFPNHPDSVQAPLHSTVSLKATVQGRYPIEFQWYLDGNPVLDEEGVEGSKTQELTIAELTENRLGEYYLLASNEFGTGTSHTASISRLTGFADWANSNGVAWEDLLGDHNGDGWSNLIHYALSSSTSEDPEAHFPHLNGNQLSYLRRVDREDIDYILQRSLDLNNWQELSSSSAEVEGVDEELEEVRFDISEDDGPAFFRLLLRLR